MTVAVEDDGVHDLTAAYLNGADRVIRVPPGRSLEPWAKGVAAIWVRQRPPWTLLPPTRWGRLVGEAVRQAGPGAAVFEVAEFVRCPARTLGVRTGAGKVVPVDPGRRPALAIMTRRQPWPMFDGCYRLTGDLVGGTDGRSPYEGGGDL